MVLNYREKNYYYLKKGTKARKKAKQAIQVEIVNDSTVSNKKKKKKKKKQQNAVNKIKEETKEEEEEL